MAFEEDNWSQRRAAFARRDGVVAPMGVGAVQPGWTPLTNVESILDVSGSMDGTDAGQQDGVVPDQPVVT
jgi:hypothetical protein